MSDYSNLADMAGRTVVITGGNAGIGKATAVGLARLGARLVITSRDAARGTNAVADIRQRAGNDAVECVPLDLASLASVRGCAKELRDRVENIDVLDLNAGGLLSDRRVSEDGLEMQFQVNHLGHFLLTQLLLDRLCESPPARVVVLSSWGHTQAKNGLNFDDLQWESRPYRGSAVYGATKLMNLYFAFELARRLSGASPTSPTSPTKATVKATVNALHPGFVASEFALGGDTRAMSIGIRIARPFARTPAKGARTAIWLAASPEAAAETGGYFINCKAAEPSPVARDANAAARLWTVSEELAGIS